MAPRHADALRSMRRVYLDAGKGDEWFLDLGAQAFARRARQARRGAHARAVRRQARRDHVPLPGRDPRARAGATVTGGRSALDVTDVTCPLTWVRTKLALERLAPGEELVVVVQPRRGARERAALGGGGRARRHRGGHAREDRAAVSEDRRAFFRGLVRSAAEVARPAAAAGGRRARRLPPRPTVERYSRQLVLPEWSEAAQLALREASVLVVGAGALGSPVAAYLAGAGVGRLGIVDSDDVEVSNLHRQSLHFTPDVGVAEGRQRGGQAALPQPGRARRALPGALRAADARGRRPRRRLLATLRRPATRSTPPAAPRASRSSRAAWSGSAGS